MELIVVSNNRNIIDRCRVCKTPRYADEPQARWERHVIKCVNEHRDELMAAHRARNPEFLKPWDPEYAAWIRSPAQVRKAIERIERGE